MELIFSNLVKVSNGSYPDAVQFYDTSAQLFSVSGGIMKGEPMKKLNGEYVTPVKEASTTVSNDSGISNLEIKSINGFGMVGCYKTANIHKMIIYEFALELGEFLNSGAIRLDANSPIASFTLSLDNPKDEGSDKQLNVAISEDGALLSPGAKVVFNFSMGDSEEYELGSYYVDRSNYSVLSEHASVEGRNLIGKALSDQTLDENNFFGYDTIDKHMEKVLVDANVSTDNFLIEASNLWNWFSFDPNTKALDTIKEMLKATINWKIEELQDGTIVIGSPNFPHFTQAGIYQFKRNDDVFSRGITRDDMSAYRKVCVHTSDWAVKAYETIGAYSGWNLQSNKTLFVNVPDGTSQAQAELYAQELSNRLQNVGKVESFTGPFRPYITPGDSARILNNISADELGLITEVVHNFGKSGGVSTDFVVDSGGRLGKGKLSDYISKITEKRGSGSIGYEELGD